jgi:transcriptional/translational regulatory protein YebC/TACO1
MMVGLDHGAEDLEDHDEAWQVTSEPGEVLSLRAALEEAGIEVLESDTTMMPTNTVPVEDASQVKAVLSLIELLDDHEDVQDVHSNIDIPDEVLEAIG